MAVMLDDLAARRGVATPTPSSTLGAQWQAWIDDAMWAISQRASRLGLDPSTLDPATVDYVVRESVLAQVARPDSATQVTVSVDDGSTSKTYSSGSGRVSILPDWWDMLGLGDGDGGAFSVRPYFVPGSLPPDMWTA